MDLVILSLSQVTRKIPELQLPLQTTPLRQQEDFELDRSTRGLLATDHVILNHGQVTWMTPQLAPPSPNYLTTPI
ncbi:hypothetical protein TNCV_3727841 [Trichonephila clavipes]|uniref:Uncharacterized protein n=1 Tax=Trichonephila clavipes TaxID=2585209 RepID=A0A8X6R2U8_TRICX|nr:hypothetical protein TNCV_3727841 [Trichonephila clavipes]